MQSVERRSWMVVWRRRSGFGAEEGVDGFGALVLDRVEEGLLIIGADGFCAPGLDRAKEGMLIIGSAKAQVLLH